jgi:cbb3-type cytochrome oxidase maturation protein
VEILVLLIPLSVVLVFLIGAGFWWCVQSGQFDDLEGPAHRILADDDSIHVAPAIVDDAMPACPRPADLTSIKARTTDRT